MKKIGLSCALSTPFAADGTVDHGRLAEHALKVIARGCDSITLFGTTGEGASIGAGERKAALAALARLQRFDARRQLIVGVAAASIEETVLQARLGYEAGAMALLMAPPFYFAETGDDGLYQFFSAVFDQLGRQARDVILYHIPGMTRNTISVDLTLRLARQFPGVVIGVKDSNGDWPATEERLRRLGELQILVGDERHLARALRKGGAGTICGLANIAPEALRRMVDSAEEDQRINAMVDALLDCVFMSAIKAMIAEETGDDGWRAMRAPLVAMDPQASRALYAKLSQIQRNAAAEVQHA